MLTENIFTRFLLHNIDPQVECKDIAEKLEFSALSILEVRRFIRQDAVPTATVLVKWAALCMRR